MHPVLFEFAGITIGSYSVLLAIAIVVSVSLAVREAERRHLPITYPMAVLVLLGALFGARVFWILQFSEPSQLWRAVILWSPGLVFYGGLVGGNLVLLVALRYRGAPLWPSLDVVAPHAALGEGIARIGCFLAGCCWGRVCTVPWGVRFPAGSFAYVDQLDAGLLDNTGATSLPVHPTQLYMAFGLAAVYAMLLFLLYRKHRAGTVVTAYIALYGLLRFTVEAFRGDSARPFLGMTVSQVISGVCFFAGLVVLLRLLIRHGTIVTSKTP